MSKVNLREADHLEIKIMVDNYTDLKLGSTEFVKRAVATMSNVSLAKHGLSYLIKVIADQKSTSLCWMQV